MYPQPKCPQLKVLELYIPWMMRSVNDATLGQSHKFKSAWMWYGLTGFHGLNLPQFYKF
jgi:hypothetical protein